ncbi:uncharacterized protein BDW43DRAFT_258856 [Aspergillus alliaceus]|uniref:uncharacterized protein n=1 Tax=Petromyces alliaceus TaxID=209559 RepID=UPI0012A5545A|nr:uncharacterized protein BDW43DRAFT_258856 [Aspergillus alliaceus]KAB8239671.1 hypothetical protein BDW43DRAFT_258856 [Aspergillus alliaceus]
MLGPLHPRSTSIWAALFLLSPLVVALRTAPGSPCAGVCNRQSTNTTGSEIACLDTDFSMTSKGSHFQQCVDCQLRSTYNDDSSGETDVDWGLYNLRYAFTSCVYGYPAQVNNISTQCTVNCQPLDTALEFDLKDPNANNFYTWCGTNAFADNLITKCEHCYNFTISQTQDPTNGQSQVFMANFLEALRYNCHFRTPTGLAFPITPTRIFSESLLPSSTVDLINPPSTGSGVNLALVIALPILGFVILLCALAICCFFFIRWRRRKARRQRQSSHLHARWNDTGISTPGHTNWANYHEMYSPAMYQQAFAQQQQGFNFVDNDGRYHDVGYSKKLSEVTESAVATPLNLTPEGEKQKAREYFGGDSKQKQ